MKKMFAASLVAIMAVSAANAEIASVSYTNKAITAKTGDISTLATTAKSNLTAAVNELVGKVGDQNVSAQVSGALTEAKGYTDTEVKKLADGAVATNTAAIAGLDNTYATDTELNNGLALKEDAANKATIFDDTNANDVNFPTTAAVKNYVSTSVSTINTDLGVTKETLGTLAQTVDTNKTAADTGIQEAKDAAAAASTAAAQALTDANAYTDTEIGKIDTAYKAADTAINDKIGTVESGKTVVQMIADAKTAATYNDTEVRGLISGNAEDIAENAAAISAINNADTGILKQAQTYADQAETDAIAAAGTAADGKIEAALQNYSTTTAMNTAIKDANDAQTTTITTAYEAADAQTLASAKSYADEKAAAATGSADAVSDALDAYKTSNDAEVAAAKSAAAAAQTQADKGVADAAAAKTQADKGVADAATAKSAADAAQATADANAAAIEGLDTTYVSESEMTSFKTSNTSAIATAKSEAIAAAKEAGDEAYDAKGAAAAAQTAAVNAAKSAADATYQVKSSALSVGAADGAWTDLTKAAGYSATGTHSLVLKNGTIQWEAVKYAE